MKKITPFLWFDAPIEQVMKFYCSIFKDSRIITVRLCWQSQVETARCDVPVAERSVRRRNQTHLTYYPIPDPHQP
jgi:predicted 3-demethylubiquinone-9 3-methyltransferase (glyoxalase superfamily)